MKFRETKSEAIRLAHKMHSSVGFEEMKEVTGMEAGIAADCL